MMTHEVESQKRKVDRIVLTMRRFLQQRARDYCSWRNEKLPSKQRKIMQSIIKQAKKINEETL